jgi:flagellar secretion chaperone FliS
LDEEGGANRIMTTNDPYYAYMEGSILDEQPLRLLVALHQGALDATRHALGCLESFDIWGRGKAINRVMAILFELLASLDEKKGGEIAQNLKRLYLYMQRQLIEAHSRQVKAPLLEVEKLFGTLNEGWREASERVVTQDIEPATPRASGRVNISEDGYAYADYLARDAEDAATPAFCF